MDDVNAERPEFTVLTADGPVWIYADGRVERAEAPVDAEYESE